MSEYVVVVSPDAIRLLASGVNEGDVLRCTR